MWLRGDITRVIITVVVLIVSLVLLYKSTVPSVPLDMPLSAEPLENGDLQFGRVVFDKARVVALDNVLHSTASVPHFAFMVMTNNIWNAERMDDSLLGGAQSTSPQVFATREASLRSFISTDVHNQVDILLVQELGVNSPITGLLKDILSDTHELLHMGKAEQAIAFNTHKFHLHRSKELVSGRGVLAVLEAKTGTNWKVGSGHIVVAASIHLPWMGTEAERSQGQSTRRQLFAHILEEVLQSLAAAGNGSGGAIIGGDMNDAFHPAEVANMNMWRDCWFDLRKISPPTYPGFFDPSRFGHVFGERGATTYDWIFANGALRSVDAKVVDVVRTVDQVPFSDHMPVLAKIEMVKTG